MAVAHYGSVNAAWGTGDLSVSFDVGTGDDRCLVVGLGNLASWGQVVSSVTYAGVALTQLASIDDNNANDQASLDVWILLNPTSGTNTLVAVTNGTNWRATAIAATGVYQVDGVRASESSTGQGHDYTISIASSADDYMYSFWHSVKNNGWSHNTAGTELYDSFGFSSVRQDTAGNPGTEQGGTSHSNGCHFGLSLWPPQNINVDVSGNPAIVASSAAIGSVDDGNITLSNITPAVVVASATMGAVLIKEPIRADMTLFN